MKKKIIYLGAILGATCLASCDIYSFLSVIDETSSADSSSSLFSTSEETSSQSNSNRSNSSSTSNTQQDGYYFIDDLTKNLSYEDLNYSQGTTVVPTKGDTKLLVLPIEFTDYPFNSTTLSDLNNALNGNGKTDTGYWESLSSYYAKSSYGKVSLSYEIADVYNAGVTAGKFYYQAVREYGEDYASGYGSSELMEKAVSNYKSKGGDTSKFDSDNDGTIDGVIMVYSCPNSYTSDISYTYRGKTYKDDGDLYWAFCYWDFNVDDTIQRSTTSPVGYLYFWMSYDFLYDAVQSPKVDTHTLIHETGHMFGLDDYYGDDVYVTGGMSMMDYNILDLDGFSKVALGWSSAYVVEDSCTINLKPMTSDGEVIIVAPSNNGTTKFNNTPFDEYMLIELYTPDNLNELDSKTTYTNGLKGFSVPGIRLWHVDARLMKQRATTSGDAPMSYTNAYTKDDGYWYFVAASNTYKISGVDDDYNLLSLIDASGKSFSSSRNSDNSTLFKTGSTFKFSSYKSFFPERTTFNNGSTFNFTINFDSVSATGATISFVRN